MATQATYCVTAYVFHQFVDFLPTKTLSFLIMSASLQESTSLILGCLVIPWVSCGSLIDVILICVYQGDF